VTRKKAPPRPQHAGPRSDGRPKRAKKPRKSRELARDVLSHDELWRLVDAATADDTDAGLRDGALIAFLAGTGLRIAEALALRPHDLDWTKLRAVVREGKGGRSRSVVTYRTLPPKPLEAKRRIGVQGLVEAWAKARADIGLSEAETLFCNLEGGRISTAYVRYMVAELGKSIGIEKRCHPHGLRHYMATTLRALELSIYEVQAQLGHASALVTERYLRRIGVDTFLENVSKFA
jgi:integrase/recombinase XerD